MFCATFCKALSIRTTSTRTTSAGLCQKKQHVSCSSWTKDSTYFHRPQFGQRVHAYIMEPAEGVEDGYESLQNSQNQDGTLDDLEHLDESDIWRLLQPPRGSQSEGAGILSVVSGAQSLTCFHARLLLPAPALCRGYCTPSN